MKISKTLLFFNLMLINGLGLSANVKASEPSVRYENGVTQAQNLMRTLLGERSELLQIDHPESRMLFVPEGYGEEFILFREDDRCHDAENQDCTILGTKSIVIKYCTPDNYSPWWHDFLTDSVLALAASPPEGFHLTTEDYGEFRNCPTDEWNQDANSIYISYGPLPGNWLGATESYVLNQRSGGYKIQSRARIVIDDDKIWDFVESECNGFTWQKYTDIMRATLNHELFAHGFHLGHNPNGNATTRRNGCPTGGDYGTITNNEWDLLSDFKPQACYIFSSVNACYSYVHNFCRNSGSPRQIEDCTNYNRDFYCDSNMCPTN